MFVVDVEANSVTCRQAASGADNHRGSRQMSFCGQEEDCQSAGQEKPDARPPESCFTQQEALKTAPGQTIPLKKAASSEQRNAI